MQKNCRLRKVDPCFLQLLRLQPNSAPRLDVMPSVRQYHVFPAPTAQLSVCSVLVRQDNMLKSQEPETWNCELFFIPQFVFPMKLIS